MQLNSLIGTIGEKEINSLDFSLQSTIPIQWDCVVKTALLTTLAGYLEKDAITVNDIQFYDVATLNNFLSFILNDKRAAPRRFTIDLSFAHRDNAYTRINNIFPLEHHSQCFIGFSGGIDSTAGILYALDRGWSVQPVWIGFGQKNEGQEKAVVQRLSRVLGLNTCYISIDLQKYVEDGWSRWKSGIIPGRNLLFASIAAQIASMSSQELSKIYICAHKEEVTDTNTDKSLRFFQMCTELFTSAYKKKIVVETPFLKITKPEMVSYWWRYWKDKYGLAPDDTVSCYVGSNCGVCKACINRAIAFSCAEVPLENFRINPFRDVEKVIATEYLQRFDSLDLDRKLDFIISMQNNKLMLSSDLLRFLNENISMYSHGLEDRRKRIIESLF